MLNENIAPLFCHHPDIHRIIPFSNNEQKGLRYLKKVWKVVRENRYDIIVDTRATIKTLFFCLFSLHTPFRIGKWKRYNFPIQNYRIKNDFDGSGDEVADTLKLLLPLEKKFPVCYERVFRLYVTAQEKSEFRDYMRQQGISFDKKILVCAVTARLPHKIWNKERMKAILLRMLDKYDIQVIFNYAGEIEKAFAMRLFEEMGQDPRVFINIEAKNLRELSAMFANTDFFFGNEGGPRHISQALDVPSLAIFPPGIPKEEWLPNASERFRGIQPSDVSDRADDPELSYADNFDLISTDAVWEQLDTMLKAYF